MTELEILKAELRKIKSYPEDMSAVHCEIAGKGFFPGARGLWNDKDESLSDKSIMILGHDFGAKADFQKSVGDGKENLNALTWKNLHRMLLNFDVSKEDCFFTNAIMGVRTTGSAIGRSPAYNHSVFLSDCKRFLIKQIDLQRPLVIVILGLQVLEFISDLTPNLNVLKNVKSFKKLDADKLSVFESLKFEEIPNYSTNLVIITHPTYYHLNFKYRQYNNLKGIEAETSIIKSVLKE